MTIRTVIEDIEFNGQCIHANEEITISITESLQTDWVDGDEFDPERWNETGQVKVSQAA